MAVFKDQPKILLHVQLSIYRYRFHVFVRTSSLLMINYISHTTINYYIHLFIKYILTVSLSTIQYSMIISHISLLQACNIAVVYLIKNFVCFNLFSILCSFKLLLPLKSKQQYAIINKNHDIF